MALVALALIADAMAAPAAAETLRVVVSDAVSGLSVTRSGVAIDMRLAEQLPMLQADRDLLSFALDKLGERPSHRITVQHDAMGGFALSAESENAPGKAIGRIDIYDSGGTPLKSVSPPFGEPVHVPEADPPHEQLVFRAYLTSGGEAVTTHTWSRPKDR